MDKDINKNWNFSLLLPVNSCINIILSIIIIFISTNIITNRLKYQPSGAGGTRSPPATPLRPTYNPQIKKRRSLLYSNLGAPINFRKTSFLIRTTFRLPSPYGGRQTSLGPPKSKNGDHFSIVIWVLQTLFSK